MMAHTCNPHTWGAREEQAFKASLYFFRLISNRKPKRKLKGTGSEMEKKLLQKHRRHILVPAVLKVSVNRKLDRIHSHLGDGLLGLLGGGGGLSWFHGLMCEDPS